MFIFYPVTASCLCIMWGNVTPLLPPSPSLPPCLENDDTMERETVIIPAYNTYKAYMSQSKEILLLNLLTHPFMTFLILPSSIRIT